ncbi:MAG TPA: toll/interleukin-1 receptor domain-containing protein [Stellaceae bacterium]|nr:toll/interleukin-1 receptor domain-containing protein [Stellaceae bacterium]
MADVFISYKTERRNAAQHLSRILELNGYSVWFDYGLLSGTDFGPQIERELRAAKAVVVLWCGLSHDSRWVLEEAHLAERLGTLTPVWLEPVELPLGFGRADTIDLANWDGSPRSRALDRLLNEISRRVGRDPEPAFRGLQHYEETWRGFGAPPLSQFALVDPIDEEARAFSVQPRPRAETPAQQPPEVQAAALATPPRAGSRNAAFAVVAVALIAAGAAAWYWTARTPPPSAPAPQAQSSQPTPPQSAAAQPANPTAAANAAPAPQAAAPVNAPIASFMRSNSGWSVSLSFVEPVAAIAWRLGDTGAFKETGVLDTLDPRTRRRMANPSFELDADQPAATIQVRAVDADGNTAGPFPVAFDPDAELARGDRRTLEMTAGSWLSFRDFNGLLVYYTHLMSYRCAIREVRIGIDTTVPNKVIPLGDCDPKHPYEIPSDAQPYLKLPPATQMVSVELTYRDGSVSETKTFRR